VEMMGASSGSNRAPSEINGSAQRKGWERPVDFNGSFQRKE